MKKFMGLVKTRVKYLHKNTLMVAAAVLDLEAHYKYNFGKDPIYAEALKKAIERIADSPQSEVQALAQFDTFYSCRDAFDTSDARLVASQMTASAWWFSYGGSTEVLQKYAMRIMSQCVSSSGSKPPTTRMRREDSNPWSMLMDAALYDQDNPIMDWLSRLMRESQIEEAIVEKSSEALLDKPLNVWASKRKRPESTSKHMAKKERKGTDECEDDVGSGEDTLTTSRSPSWEDTDGNSSPSIDDEPNAFIRKEGGIVKDDDAACRPGKTAMKKTKDLSTLY